MKCDSCEFEGVVSDAKKHVEDTGHVVRSPYLVLTPAAKKEEVKP